MLRLQLLLLLEACCDVWQVVDHQQSLGAQRKHAPRGAHQFSMQAFVGSKCLSKMLIESKGLQGTRWIARQSGLLVHDTECIPACPWKCCSQCRAPPTTRLALASLHSTTLDSPARHGLVTSIPQLPRAPAPLTGHPPAPQMQVTLRNPSSTPIPSFTQLRPLTLPVTQLPPALHHHLTPCQASTPSLPPSP